MVAVIGVDPGLVAVNVGKLPLPDAINPIEVFEFVQLKFAPVGVDEKVVAGTFAVLQ
jgi:hypothetical protein